MFLARGVSSGLLCVEECPKKFFPIYALLAQLVCALRSTFRVEPGPVLAPCAI